MDLKGLSHRLSFSGPTEGEGKSVFGEAAASLKQMAEAFFQSAPEISKVLETAIGARSARPNAAGDSAVRAIVLVDAAGRIVSADSEGEKLLAVTGPVVGKNLSEFLRGYVEGSTSAELIRTGAGRASVL